MLAAFTAASVYAFRAGGAGLVAVLGLLKALPGAFLVPLVTSGSDRVRRERLLIATLVPRALLLGVAAAAMTGGGQGLLVVVLVGVEGGVASAFRQIQAALLPWLARTPDELTSANFAASVLQSAAMVGGPAIAAGLTVVIALELFGLGSASVGWLGAVLGVGGLLVGPVAVMLVRGKRVARSFAAGVAGWDAPMILLGFAHGPYWPYLMFGVIGVANVFDGMISAPGPDLALLRQVSFFHPLPFAIVEHLASELQSATYEPGDVIIREGEPGERFYIIAEGRARL